MICWQSSSSRTRSLRVSYVVDVERLAEARVGLHQPRVWREIDLHGVTAFFMVVAFGQPIDVIAVGSLYSKHG